jgi:hypothetical protein
MSAVASMYTRFGYQAPWKRTTSPWSSIEIALDLDQQRPARQQRPDRVAVDILDVKACRKYRFGGHFLAATGAGATAGATGVPSSNPGPA